ncbi:LytR/AlgR family response regulator transcription factor [Bacilliculturomica massiliensis]|uniref:LytR/AlgR family response regulator transcription factor n=1 Tax=Bacilliculturomica massiliensis TaxID=1917867 RepID=UPI0010318CB0|nr:response regulator [Bacilliculturomica massiliensis]
MRIAVVDDERLIRKDLIYYLKDLAPDAEIEEADSGFTAVELANSKPFDIFFLDINLGDMKGTVLALMLQKTAPEASVVFVTAYGEYGPQAFELNAVDYIMKPFNKARVEKALKKAVQMRNLARLEKMEEAGRSSGSMAGAAGPGLLEPRGLPGLPGLQAPGRERAMARKPDGKLGGWMGSESESRIRERSRSITTGK